ncbi:MAG: O-antigen ligase family protein, partial [Bacteroidota bacterium]|nr:O-antigen ligase family protein [Bacteroidota bacterium]MDX5431864.1 O-antigen ligase family protein [Bacteroidota bacterium]MDX5470576.1 O-antigen ligase family protein [Bacteroidota bacterium]
DTLEELPFKALLKAWFIVIILLLSSKLFILLLVAYLLFSLLRMGFLNKSRRQALVLTSTLGGMLLLFGFDNPISSRFKDLSLERLKYLQQDHIGEDVYLDGLSLRLLQLRFAGEILSDSKAWLFGVGPGASQAKLDNKYREVHLYAQNSSETDVYFGLNFQNQYAETLVQGGLVALASLFLLFFGLIYHAWKRQQQVSLILLLLFMIFCLSESVFERQLGVFSFLLFSLFPFASNKTSHHKKPKHDLRPTHQQASDL